MCGCSPTATSPPRPTAVRSAAAAAPMSRSLYRRIPCWPISSPRLLPALARYGLPTAGSVDRSTGTHDSAAGRTSGSSRRTRRLSLAVLLLGFGQAPRELVEIAGADQLTPGGVAARRHGPVITGD